MEQKVLKKSFADGVLTLTYEMIDEVLVIDTSKYPEQNHADAQEHGYLQRFGDLESGDKVGRAKFEAAKELDAHYRAGGDWRMSGERDTTAVVIEALHRINPRKYTEAKLKKAAAETPEVVKEWRQNLKVRAEIAKIYAERAAAKVDEEEIEIELK